MKSILKTIDAIGNLIIINLLFILTTVMTLGFGFGCSLSALYATLLELRTDDSGYYVRNYFKNFKRNFSVSIKVWIIILLLIGATYLNFLMIQTFNSMELRLFLYPVVGAFAIELFFVLVYVFIIIAKFEVDTIKAFLLALMYAHKYIHYTLLFVILWFLSIMVPTYLSFAFIFIIFALVAKIQSNMLNRLWRVMFANEEISEF